MVFADIVECDMHDKGRTFHKSGTMSNTDKVRLKVLEQELRDVLYQLKDDDLLDIFERHPEEAERLRSLLTGESEQG